MKSGANTWKVSTLIFSKSLNSISLTNGKHKGRKTIYSKKSKDLLCNTRNLSLLSIVGSKRLTELCSHLLLLNLIISFMAIFILAQSICTHYSCFENQGRFVTLKKKLGILLFSKSRVQKTRVIVIQKEKRQPGLFSFWITMTLLFCTLFFAKSRVPDISKVPDPKKISSRPDKLE